LIQNLSVGTRKTKSDFLNMPLGTRKLKKDRRRPKPVYWKWKKNDKLNLPGGTKNESADPFIGVYGEVWKHHHYSQVTTNQSLVTACIGLESDPEPSQNLTQLENIMIILVTLRHRWVQGSLYHHILLRNFENKSHRENLVSILF